MKMGEWYVDQVIEIQIVSIVNSSIFQVIEPCSSKNGLIPLYPGQVLLISRSKHINNVACEELTTMKKHVDFMGAIVNPMCHISCQCELPWLRIRSGLGLKAMIQLLLLLSWMVLDIIVLLSPTTSSLETNHFLCKGRGGGIEEGHKQGEGHLFTSKAQIGGVRWCPVVL